MLSGKPSILSLTGCLLYTSVDECILRAIAFRYDGEVLAIVTIVTERYRTQYALIYTTRISEAVDIETVGLL